MSGPDSVLWIKLCECLQFFKCVWFNSRYVGLNEPPILASIASFNTSANLWALGAQRIHLIRCTWYFQHHNKDLAVTIQLWTTDMTSALFPSTPRIASSSSESCFYQARTELHPLRLNVSLLTCFPVNLLNFLLYLPLYTSLYIPNFISSIMEPMASQVRNYYSQKNQEALLQRALACASMNTANHHCRTNVWNSNRAFKYSVGDN